MPVDLSLPLAARRDDIGVRPGARRFLIGVGFRPQVADLCVGIGARLGLVGVVFATFGGDVCTGFGQRGFDLRTMLFLGDDPGFLGRGRTRDGGERAACCGSDLARGGRHRGQLFRRCPGFWGDPRPGDPRPG